jgi:hypothetical protein
MPTRSYRRNLRSSASSQRTFISKPSSSKLTFNGTCSDVQFYIQVETYLFNVIEAITNKIELDKVIEEITIVQGMLKTKDDALDLLDMIQNTVLDILFNITTGVSLDIVNNRISYLRDLINRADPDKFPIICSDVVQGISDILDMFGNSTDLDQILTGLTAIQERMVNDVGKADLIEDTQCALFGIIDNISNGVSLDIVNNRITYVQELVRQIQVLGIL